MRMMQDFESFQLRMRLAGQIQTPHVPYRGQGHFRGLLADRLDRHGGKEQSSDGQEARCESFSSFVLS